MKEKAKEILLNECDGSAEAMCIKCQRLLRERGFLRERDAEESMSTVWEAFWALVDEGKLKYKDGLLVLKPHRGVNLKAEAKRILMSLTDKFKSERIKQAIKMLEFETARPGEYTDSEEYRRIVYAAFDELVREGKIIYDPYKPIKMGPTETETETKSATIKEIHELVALDLEKRTQKDLYKMSDYSQRFLAQFAENLSEKLRRKDMNITKSIAKAFPKTDDAVLVAKHFSFNEVESILLTSSADFAAAILAAAQEKEKENESQTA